MKIEPREINSDFRFVLSSGDGDDYPGCKLNISFYKWNITFDLPPIIKPGICRVRGKYNYDELIESRYGIYLFENHFNILYGRGDANFNRDIFGDEQRWSFFLPWTEYRMVRHSLYDVKGELFYTRLHGKKYENLPLNDDSNRVKDCPKVSFTIIDFDGEEIEAVTYIEEREWYKGEGWFKFLSLFTEPKIRRSLSIEFNKETGKRKGSWKGGTMGCGIDMEDTELHAPAFQRYCQKNNMVIKEVKWDTYS